jgi:hypothetical protein
MNRAMNHLRRRRAPAGLLAALAGLLLLATAAGPARAAAGLTPRADAERVERFWTPARMREARPLEYRVGPHGGGRLLAAAQLATSSGSSTQVPNPEEAPNTVNGRIFLRQGKLMGFCSGTAINSPTRALVLTAGHCVGSGPQGRRRRNIRSSFLEFVPAYNDGAAPFGAFVAIRGEVLAPKQWTSFGNPDFDLGAFLTRPNAEGVNVADAVGGGATIAMDLDRHQTFQSFGYPGETKLMRTCSSPYIGDDAFSYPLPGPPTQAIRCHWPPGSSGGGWLINGGAEIDGITTYFHLHNTSQAYGPYFSQETVGRLVAGL